MAGLMRREPHGEAADVFSRFDRLFDEWVRMMPFRSTALPRWLEAGDLIRLEEYREDGTLVVRADLPGIDPDKDVELTVASGMLHIQAERRTGPGRLSGHRSDSAVVGRSMVHAAGARVAVQGAEHVRPGTAYVVVSNHQSNLDPTVHLRVLPPGLRILAKREMFRIWLLGPAMRAAGMIEVTGTPPTTARSTRRPPGPWPPGTRCWSTRRGPPPPTARSARSRTAPSPSRSPARHRSCRSPSAAPAVSGHRA